MVKRQNTNGQIRREDYDATEDEPAAGPGTFKRASEEVMKTRRIVKARRPQGSAPPITPPAASNPFASVELVDKPKVNPFASVTLVAKETQDGGPVGAPGVEKQATPAGEDPGRESAATEGKPPAPAPANEEGAPTNEEAAPTNEEGVPGTDRADAAPGEEGKEVKKEAKAEEDLPEVATGKETTDEK